MRHDEGVSIVELMITIALLAVVGLVFGSTLTTSLNVTKDFEGAARSNDDVRLVLQQINRELRSAEKICTPTPGTTGSTLEFYTVAYTSTTTSSGVQHLIYQLRDQDGDGTPTDFQRSADGGLTWRTVIDSVVNDTLGVPVFATQGNTASAAPSEGKVVTVTIWVDPDGGDRLTPKLATTEVSGRNIWTPNSPGC